MPGITQRICGICPVSHTLASAKAGDAIMAVNIPPAADKLRRLMNLGQFVQSHALSFFHLSAPDFLLGWDTPPAQRNVFGIIAANEDLARAGIRLRQFGQEIIEILGGKKIHPAWAVPGGVRSPLTEEGRAKIRAWLPEAFATTKVALDLWKKTMETHQREIQIFGNFPSLFMGLVAPDGTWEHHGGKLRFTDSSGSIIADQLDPQKYYEFIGESVQTLVLSQIAVLPAAGFSRRHVSRRPARAAQRRRADGRAEGGRRIEEFQEARARRGHVVVPVPLRAAHRNPRVARIHRALHGRSELLSDYLRADAGINSLRGVGASEAPRGTLFHDYTVDRNGLLKKVNLIVATGQNNLAMNQTVAQIARHYVRGNDIPEPMLNRVEHGIRCYDPCLSCSTHAVGQMPLHVRLIAPDGTVLNELARG